MESILAHPSDSTCVDIICLIESNPLLKPRCFIMILTWRAINPLNSTQQEVKYLVEHGLAVPSTGAWSSPCVLVPKPDNTPGSCNDYRKVNAVPRMEDRIDRVGPGQVRNQAGPRASQISDDFLQDTVMLFGLRHAIATFQRR